MLQLIRGTKIKCYMVVIIAIKSDDAGQSYVYVPLTSPCLLGRQPPPQLCK